MALAKFVFECKDSSRNKELADFLDLLSELAAESPDGVIDLKRLNSEDTRFSNGDVLITDAQWCMINMSALSLRLEGNVLNMLSDIAGMLSLDEKDVSVYFSMVDLESNQAITNDKDSKYYDSRVALSLTVNPKLAEFSRLLYQSLQDTVGGVYRFRDEASMKQFVFESYGFRPVSLEQIAEIVELYTYQMILDSGVNLDIDEALTNTGIINYEVCD